MRASSTTVTLLGVVVPVGTIAPGASGNVDVPLYVGPQDQAALASLAEGFGTSPSITASSP